MKNNGYWQRRMELIEEMQIKKGENYLNDLDDQYRKASREIDKQISSWYRRFAANNEITMTEARKILSTKELKEFHWDVNEYIKYGEENALDQRWMKELENASARVHVSRLEALKVQMQQQVEVLYGDQLDDVDDLLRGIYKDGYYHTAFEIQRGFNIGWDLHSINNNQLDKILSKPWTMDGKTFSDRIWTNKQLMIGNLQTHLTQSVITGRSPDEIIKRLSEQFGTDRKKAGRLVMTESAAFASAAQKDAFNDLDVERFEIVATLDNNTSAICQDLDGHVFDMKDYEVGATAPPFHSWCRTVTAPYFDDEFSLGERAARDANGETYYVPSDMKYHKWKESFVDGGSKDGLIKTAVPGILKGTTLEEIQNNIKMTAELKKPVDLNGVDLEVAQGIEEAYNKIMRKYPQLKGQFAGLGTNENGKMVYASCTVLSGDVNVNLKTFGNIKRLSRSYSSNVANNFHPQGTDWKSIVTHELGHAVDGYLTMNGYGSLKGNKFIYSSTEMRKRVLKELKMTKKFIKDEVSDYATKDDHEFFAECFAEYIDSEDPRPVAKKFGEILEEWMKGTVK